MAPKVANDAKESLVLDESPSTVDQANDQETEVIETDQERMSAHLLKKRHFKRYTTWPEIETLKFYRVLSTTGTVFSAMQSHFPNLSYQALKGKFKHEEKRNPEKIDRALRWHYLNQGKMPAPSSFLLHGKPDIEYGFRLFF
ncbi:unnamed protein product [Soboliphyme baturini]|uniref:Myb_DNA-bind_7 domain-containing protein n=1 Tax=Soboliphyme baturini TaxID=241478 RepID=A0A183IBJ8_9BILA|nr:unnamed protein product [Soboliphyme baturini]